MSTFITIKPELLRWARERASLTQDELAIRIGSKNKPAPLHDWEETGQLPFRMLEMIASKTHTPLGYMFLHEPPEEPAPIHDFRKSNKAMGPGISLDLLETIYDCQYRQAWMSSRLQHENHEQLRFIGSAKITDNPSDIATNVISTCKIGIDARIQNTSVESAVLWIISRFEDCGILVQRSGIVGNNTHRPLNIDEFKGFALSDAYAPMIFINGKDWEASQMFTLVHEAVHLWLGESAVPDTDLTNESAIPIERFCNSIAAEILLPAQQLREDWTTNGDPGMIARRLAQTYKVSTIVVLIRAWTIGLMPSEILQAAINAEQRTSSSTTRGAIGSGGNFYNTAGIRLGKRFIREVLTSTLEGKTLYSDAFKLLGTDKTSVFKEMVDKFLHGGD